MFSTASIRKRSTLVSSLACMRLLRLRRLKREKRKRLTDERRRRLMGITRCLLLGTMLLLASCATPVPVAVSCPPPPPPPEVLKESPSTGPSLSERYNILILEFRDSLQKAIRP